MHFKVSILVTMFNAEEWIERCARSLFEQTYPHIEFIFIDDGSSDNCVIVLKQVIDDYPERKDAVKIVCHKNNKGIAISRNTTLDNATCEFICWVDSDDWMVPNAITLLVNKQLEHCADLVSGNRIIHYPDKESLLLEYKYSSKEEMTIQMMQRTWDHFITGRLIRRSLFVDYNLRFKEGLDVAEDRYMMVLLSYWAKGFDTIDEVVYHYERRNTNSITRNQDCHKIFKINNQELENLKLLRSFFINKEEIYQNECMRCYMKQLKYNLIMAIAYSSKSVYRTIVDAIDVCSPNEWKPIGWKKNGFKGWCLHNYRLMRLNWLRIKTIRFINKKWRKLFQ